MKNNITRLYLCSSALVKPVKSQLVILGSMSIGETISKVTYLADILQTILDAEGKKILVSMSSASDTSSVSRTVL